MRNLIQRYFAVTENGAQNILRAAVFSFLKYFTLIMPPGLVFFFLQDYLNGELKKPTIYLAILAAVVLVMYIVLIKEYKKTYDVTFEESEKLRIDIANKLKELPLSYFSKHNLTDLSQSVMMDVGNIEMAISHAIPQGMGFVGFFIILSVAFVAYVPLLGLCVIAPIWIALLLVLLTRKIHNVHVTRYYESLLRNANVFQEAFELQEEIKSYSMQEEVRKQVHDAIESTERLHLKSELAMGAVGSLIGILPFISPVLTGIVGAFLFADGQITALYFSGYLIAATTLSAQYAGIQEFLLMVLFFGDSFKRIRELRSVPVQSGSDVTIDDSSVEFKDVKFAYGDNKVINGISFTAKKGEVTALVGPSGCGKTTVLRLASRLYDYDEGKITIGGKDIKEMSTRSLFDNLSIVFQNIDLFDTSVLENIRMGRKDATDEEVIAVAKLANVDEIVKKLPDGYNTIIGENGSKLSGGERQRISIARAFLKDAPIILLDEISASIDVENEMDIQKSLNKLIKDKTVIIISHRLKSVEKADKIVLMDEGKIAATGTHAELLKESKLYQTMIEKSMLTDEFTY